MKNLLFRKVLYGLSILAIGITIVVSLVLPWITNWYGELVGISRIEGSTLVFTYLTIIPFIVILFIVNRLSHSLLKDNCFNSDSLKALKIIGICSLIDFTIYFIGTIFIYRNLICFVLTLATLMVATISWIIKELVANGIELKEENDLTI